MSIVKLNNRGVRSATTFGSISALGEMRFIKKQTASSSATISFIHGTSDVVFDGTYKEYLFTFNNIHPETDQVSFEFNFTTDGTNWNVTKTTTSILYYHFESGSASGVQYDTNQDLAQGTGFQNLASNADNDNDSSGAGMLSVFSPSSTTYVKHFMSNYTYSRDGSKLYSTKNAGYGNTTSAITGVQFKFDSGDIDAGDICLYGIN